MVARVSNAQKLRIYFKVPPMAYYAATETAAVAAPARDYISHEFS